MPMVPKDLRALRFFVTHHNRINRTHLSILPPDWHAPLTLFSLEDLRPMPSFTCTRIVTHCQCSLYRPRLIATATAASSYQLHAAIVPRCVFYAKRTQRIESAIRIPGAQPPANARATKWRSAGRSTRMSWGLRASAASESFAWTTGILEDPLLTPANGDNRTTWLQRASISWGLHHRSFAVANAMSSPPPAVTNTHDRHANDEAFERKPSACFTSQRRSQRHAMRHPIAHLFTSTASQEENLHPILEGVGGGLVPDLRLYGDVNPAESTSWPPVLFAADLCSQALITRALDEFLTNSLGPVPFIPADHALAISQLSKKSFLEAAVFEDQ
ncbi:hypothetical protein BJ912DRAFT_1059322 [Pholiota molesta]|nr:hypothetical protein BJ912DRAFT_1059322 [Pholiota molesta]